MTFSPETKTLLSSELNKHEIEALEELADYTAHDTEDEYLTAIKDYDDGGLSEAVGEWADAQVSVYTSHIYEWATENMGAVREHEEELLACGYKSIEDILAVCWYRHEEERMNEILSDARKALERAPDHGTCGDDGDYSINSFKP